MKTINHKNDYKIFDWKGSAYLGGVNIKDGRKYYNYFLSKAEKRTSYFVSFIFGEGVNLDYSVESLDYLNKWLYFQLTKNYKHNVLVKKIGRGRDFIFGDALNSFHRSLVNDVSLYIVEIWKKECEGDFLYWGHIKSSDSVDGYNWPGIKGFPGTNRKYIYPVVFYVYIYVFKILDGKYDCIERCLKDRMLSRKYKSNGKQSIPNLPNKII